MRWLSFSALSGRQHPDQTDTGFLFTIHEHLHPLGYIVPTQLLLSKNLNELDNIPFQPRNHVTMSARISGSSYFQARSEEKVTSTHYFVRITNKHFNFSNNPTFVTGSSGQFLHASMVRNPSVYVTTIGMYDTINRLVAVAKLSRPLLKSFNREALIKVKLDY